MKRNKKFSSLMIIVCMLTLLLPNRSVFAATSTEGTLKKLTDIGGNGSTVYVYSPPTPTTNGLMSPIVVLYGDKSYANESDVQAALETSGIKNLADQHGFFVYLPNQNNGSTWDASDVSVYKGIIEMTTNAGYAPGGMKDGKYAGDQSLINLIGEGSGADFINANLLKTYTLSGIIPFPYAPAAVLTFNASNEPETTLPMPAFVVNGTSAVIDQFKQINQTNVSTKIDGINVFKNQESPAQKVMTIDSTKMSGFDATITHKAYEMLLSETRRRQVTASGDAALQLFERPDYAKLGLTVNSHVEEFVQEAGERKHTWYEFIPQSVQKSNKKVPLVLIFHGGGNHALFQAETSEFPVIAAKEGFIVVSIQHQDSGIENETPESIIDLLKYLETKLPVDTSRVYASGFSMGSVMTFNLGIKYPEYFAGIAPMDGAFPVEGTKNLNIPTFYSAGMDSPLPEFPHQLNTIFPQDAGKPNNIDNILETVYRMNGVNYPGFNRDFGIWGIASDKTYSITTKNGLNTITVSLVNSEKDGVAYTALSAVANKGHLILPAESFAAWDFLKNFKRLPNGKIKVIEKDVTKK